jgi:hypothetical protein
MAGMKPGRLVQVFSELLMIVLGLLLVFLALSGRFRPPSGIALWVGLGALLIIWGLRVWLRRGQMARPAARALQWVRGWSLLVSGTVLIATLWMSFSSAPLLLATVGAILAVRGTIGAGLAIRLALS